jgi:hypothetical protein
MAGASAAISPFSSMELEIIITGVSITTLLVLLELFWKVAAWHTSVNVQLTQHKETLDSARTELNGMHTEIGEHAIRLNTLETKAGLEHG